MVVRATTAYAPRRLRPAAPALAPPHAARSPTHLPPPAALPPTRAADIGHYYYGPGHPMKPHRMKLTHHLIMGYGLYRKMECYRPHLASPDELARFHSEDYVDFLRRVTPENCKAMTTQMQKCAAAAGSGWLRRPGGEGALGSCPAPQEPSRAPSNHHRLDSPPPRLTVATLPPTPLPRLPSRPPSLPPSLRRQHWRVHGLPRV